jgi:hypothetical protein
MSASTVVNRKAGLSGNDAELLAKICYLHAKADPRITVQRDGHVWLTKTQADLCKLTGLTVSQCRRSISRLRQSGRLITEQHIRYNRTITFMRPIQSAQNCAAHSEQKCAVQTEQNCTVQSVQNCTVTKEPTNDEANDDAFPVALAHGLDAPCGHQGAGEEDKQGKEEDKEASKHSPLPPPPPSSETAMTSAAEIAAMSEAAKQAKRDKVRDMQADPARPDTQGAGRDLAAGAGRARGQDGRTHRPRHRLLQGADEAVRARRGTRGVGDGGAALEWSRELPEGRMGRLGAGP